MHVQLNHLDVIKVSTDTVACDGNDGVLGHPRVFLDLSKTEFAVCPYCSKKYELEKQE